MNATSKQQTGIYKIVNHWKWVRIWWYIIMEW